MRSGLAASLSRSSVSFRKLTVGARIAFAVLAVIVLVAVVGPFLTQDPLASGMPVQPPSGEHLFGTDRQGRDVLARVVHGAASSLIIGLGATVVALFLGGALGALAATSRKWADETVMRVLDVVLAFPGIALAAVLAAVFGTSVPVLVLTIAIVYTPQLARVVRANVLAQYGEDYVAAEKVIGARRQYIVTRHVLINCAAPILVFATILIADAIILEASLSFIGAGVAPPAPSWGNVLSEGRQVLLSGGWWVTLFPGLAVVLTVLSLNILAEGMTDVSAAPATTPAQRGGDEEDGAEAAASTAEADAALTRLSEWQPRVEPVSADTPELLSVRNLTIRFPARYGNATVVDGISFTVREGETLGLVGESGCGKSITSLAVMGLQARGCEVTGNIVYKGQELVALPERQRRAMSGPEIAMVYQDALSSLNPSMLVGSQLRQLTSRGATRSPAELLDMVELVPQRTLKSYPHELSGGQRQRVLIAMALSRDPRLLVADEPTTALDVTVQAQIVELLASLRDELGFAMILVSHDLALVGELAHKIAVMYAGQFAEFGDSAAVLTGPRHHYSRGLLSAVVSLEAGSQRLHHIRGVVPAPDAFGAGCRFAARCSAATMLCHTTVPKLDGGDARHGFACHHPAVAATAERSLR